MIYIRWSDDGQHIRKWDTKPFDGSEPMYSRSWLLSEERLEAATLGAVNWDQARLDMPAIASMADFRNEVDCSAYTGLARAALSSAIGEPYEFSGWVEVVEDGE
ncbi:MAG: hypothetical protein IE934_08865 [Sphingopyxis sp.]|nr:hypothetical protein [Sphingopyxis sp.]